MQWRPTMSTGMQEIDNQYKILFEKVEEANRKLMSIKGDSGLKEVITQLKFYFSKHFEYEEELQRNSGYPQYLQHKFEHDNFLKKIDEIAQAYYMDKVNNSRIGVQQSIFEWMFKHNAMSDKTFAKYYNDYKKSNNLS